MFNYVGYTCRLHAYDMFDEMPVMASKGMIKILFNLLVMHHCFPVILLLLSYHSILSNDLGSPPEKSGSNPRDIGITQENWVPGHWYAIL